MDIFECCVIHHPDQNPEDLLFNHCFYKKCEPWLSDTKENYIKFLRKLHIHDELSDEEIWDHACELYGDNIVGNNMYTDYNRDYKYMCSTRLKEYKVKDYKLGPKFSVVNANGEWFNREDNVMYGCEIAKINDKILGTCDEWNNTFAARFLDSADDDDIITIYALET